MRRRRGFTLIELLVTISVIAILIALLMPAVQNARESARRTSCQNHLKQQCLALHSYHDAHKIFPSGAIVQGPGISSLSGWGWGAMILPYLDQAPLYDQIDFDHGTLEGSNRRVIQNSLKVWHCPTDIGQTKVELDLTSGNMINESNIPPSPSAFGIERVSTGNYCGNGSLLGPLTSSSLRDVRDGSSSTFLLGEHRYTPQQLLPGNDSFSAWYGLIANRYGYTFNSVPYVAVQGFNSLHQGGHYTALCDGSVKLVSSDIDKGILEALGTPAGGEKVGAW